MVKIIRQKLSCKCGNRTKFKITKCKIYFTDKIKYSIKIVCKKCNNLLFYEKIDKQKRGV